MAKSSKAFLGMDTENRFIELLPLIKETLGLTLFKVPTPQYYRGKSTIDFVGFDSNGRSVGIEAKSTVKDRFYLSSVRENQQEYLKELDKSGGLAYILCDFVAESRWFLVPWKKTDGSKTINLVEFDDYERSYWDFSAIKGGSECR